MSQPPVQQTAPQAPYPVQSPYPYYHTPPRVGAAGRFARLMRLLLRRVLYNLVLLGRAMRPYALTLAVAFVLLSVIGWMSWQLWGPKPDGPTFTRADSIPPAPAVLNYLQGRKTFNADLMWDSFSTEYQTARLNAGASKATLQSQANIEKNMGLVYNRYDYIGGIPLDDGGSMYFYAVQVSLQSQKAKVPLIITANPDGKIINIISPLDRLSQNN
ncbi:MAG: hypothetical protein RMJ55_02130 [Roseiflexaceae bacterium]|nr:hypothetical protein [Roseiflexus sp.]MDW8212328.1 hypothetical protein [Roseiflexaceae bacterium]